MVKSEKRGSNPRPRPWQGRALPTELFSHYIILRTGILLLYRDANVILKLNYTNLFYKKSQQNHNLLKANSLLKVLFFRQHPFNFIEFH